MIEKSHTKDDEEYLLLRLDALMAALEKVYGQKMHAFLIPIALKEFEAPEVGCMTRLEGMEKTELLYAISMAAAVLVEQDHKMLDKLIAGLNFMKKQPRGH